MLHRWWWLLPSCGLIAALAGTYACTSKNNPSAPGSPGGGGGGANVLNLPMSGHGGSQSFTFTAEGSFPYKCFIHSSVMTGDTVVVSRSSVADSALVQVVGVSRPGFSPRTVTIKPGGSVRWINTDGTRHIVVNQ